MNRRLTPIGLLVLFIIGLLSAKVIFAAKGEYSDQLKQGTPVPTATPHPTPTPPPRGSVEIIASIDGSNIIVKWNSKNVISVNVEGPELSSSQQSGSKTIDISDTVVAKEEEKFTFKIKGRGYDGKEVNPPGCAVVTYRPPSDPCPGYKKNVEKCEKNLAKCIKEIEAAKKDCIAWSEIEALKAKQSEAVKHLEKCKSLAKIQLFIKLATGSWKLVIGEGSVIINTAAFCQRIITKREYNVKLAKQTLNAITTQLRAKEQRYKECQLIIDNLIGKKLDAEIALAIAKNIYDLMCGK